MSSFLISYRLVQQIIDAILVLNIDDPPCTIGAAALLFVLASDVSTSQSHPCASVHASFYFLRISIVFFYITAHKNNHIMAKLFISPVQLYKYSPLFHEYLGM